MLPKVLKGHIAVFTRGDFQRKNIIVRCRNSVACGVRMVVNDWKRALVLIKYP